MDGEHRAHPELGVAGNKPPRAVDRCFDDERHRDRGRRDVWDGVLDDVPPGACTQPFPLYSNSRRVAGGPFEGGIFKCALQTVDAAIAAGVYGSWVPSTAERARLDADLPARRVRLEPARRRPSGGLSATRHAGVGVD